MAAAYIPCDFPYFPIPYGCFCGITITLPVHPPVDAFDESCMIHDQVCRHWLSRATAMATVKATDTAMSKAAAMAMAMATDMAMATAMA